MDALRSEAEKERDRERRNPSSLLLRLQCAVKVYRFYKISFPSFSLSPSSHVRLCVFAGGGGGGGGGGDGHVGRIKHLLLLLLS